MANRTQNKYLQSAQRTLQTPVYKTGKVHVQLWEVLGLGALAYFGYKMIKDPIDANTANAQADKAGTDPATQSAVILYSAMVPGFGSTDTATVLAQSKIITNFAAVTDAYKNLHQRILTTDLEKYLSAADLQTFMQNISNANVNQGTMDVNQEAAKFYGILHSIVPVNDAQEVQLMELANDINNSGATNPMALFKNIATAYKAKYGSDMEKDLYAFWQNYDSKYASDHDDDFNNEITGGAVIQFPDDYRDQYH
jgi:hypothetical protein